MPCSTGRAPAAVGIAVAYATTAVTSNSPGCHVSSVTDLGRATAVAAAVVEGHSLAIFGGSNGLVQAVDLETGLPSHLIRVQDGRQATALSASHASGRRSAVGLVADHERIVAASAA
ncbi:hypothetical protein ACH4XT_26200 [Streptomyces avidinii]|uniref:hypothetical protein n=1 Tax=Streptomyces avidinii TaxID=1895 RepID=UPI00378B122E|nr:hypothetical protein OG592_37040 [Streptomyces avidinii]